MSYYSINGVSIVAPSGTIASYLGVGDPAGWLICDGGARTATIPNEFAALAAILNTTYGITSNTANSVVTPNLQSTFLEGRSSTSSGVSTTGGSASVTLTTNNLPSHTHNISASGITTTVTASFTTSISGNGFTTDTNTWKGGGSASGGFVGNTTSLSATTTGTISASTTISSLSASITGSGNSFSILPPYFTVNYIIKI